MAMLARETLRTSSLTLVILPISAPFLISISVSSSFQDTRAEIIKVEPERITLQKPPYCCQWIFVLLQPTEIMV